MSKAQWGNGYWKGYYDGKKFRVPKLNYFGHGWHFCFKHCWGKMLFKHPFKLDTSDPDYYVLTVLGFVWFFNR